MGRTGVYLIRRKTPSSAGSSVEKSPRKFGTGGPKVVTSFHANRRKETPPTRRQSLREQAAGTIRPPEFRPGSPAVPPEGTHLPRAHRVHPPADPGIEEGPRSLLQGHELPAALQEREVARRPTAPRRRSGGPWR